MDINQKNNKRGLIGCGGRIWTYDLQVMSLTSYRAAPPRVKKKIVVAERLGSDLLSHTLRCSTISATVLNGRVREGTGCFTCAIATKPNKMQRTPIVRDWEIQILIWLFLNQIKPIGQLVPVNWACYHAYISGLSTWWSTTALRDTLFWGGLPA